MAEETKKYVDFKRGSQADYDALQSKDENTLYFITDNGKIYLGEKLVADSKGLTNVEFADNVLTFTLEDGSTTTVDITKLLTIGEAADEGKIVIIGADGGVTISEVNITDIEDLKGKVESLESLNPSSVIVWDENSNANDYIETGLYHFAGYHMSEGDNLPIIANSGENANVAFTLVVDKKEGKYENNSHIQTVIGQTLLLSNRKGSETKIYTRHAQQSVAGDNIGYITWGPWRELVSSTYLGIIDSYESEILSENAKEIGLYTGAIVNEDTGTADVFKLEVINNYSVAGEQNTILQSMTVVSINGTSKELQRTKSPETGEWTPWVEVTDADKQDLVTDATENNVATFDGNGQVKDSGVKAGEDEFGSESYIRIKNVSTDNTYYYTKSQEWDIPEGTPIYSDQAWTEEVGTVTASLQYGYYNVSLSNGESLEQCEGATYNKPSHKTLATEAGVVNYVSKYVDPKVSALQLSIDNLSQESEAELAIKADKVTGATDGNLAGLDENGNLTDSGVKAGGATLAEAADATTLATEAAVKAAIDDITISVAEDDKVLSTDAATGKVLSSTLTLDYDSDAKKIYLKGINGAEIDSIDTADFVVDGMLKEAELGYCKVVGDVHVDAQEGEEGAVPCIKLTFNADAGDKVIHVELSKLVDVYTAGLGLEADANNKYQFNVKIAGQSEGFLTVTADGVKLSGVQDAINTAKGEAIAAGEAAAEAVKTAVDAYTVNGKAISENPVLGSEDIARPAAEGETAKTVEETLAALEGAAADVDGKITDAINALDAEVTSEDGTNVNVKVTQVDGVVTAVNVVTDNTASAEDLTKETERAEQAEQDLADAIVKAEEDANAYTDEKVEANRLVWGSIA